MLATLTSKGQITLPKEIREKLKLDAGATLNFELLADDTITARAVRPDARNIRGLLKSPHGKALTVAQMDAAVGIALSKKYQTPAPVTPANAPATTKARLNNKAKVQSR